MVGWAIACKQLKLQYALSSPKLRILAKLAVFHLTVFKNTHHKNVQVLEYLLEDDRLLN